MNNFLIIISICWLSASKSSFVLSNENNFDYDKQILLQPSNLVSQVNSDYNKKNTDFDKNVVDNEQDLSSDLTREKRLLLGPHRRVLGLRRYGPYYHHYGLYAPYNTHNYHENYNHVHPHETPLLYEHSLHETPLLHQPEQKQLHNENLHGQQLHNNEGIYENGKICFPLHHLHEKQLPKYLQNTLAFKKNLLNPHQNILHNHRIHGVGHHLENHHSLPCLINKQESETKDNCDCSKQQNLLIKNEKLTNCAPNNVLPPQKCPTAENKLKPNKKLQCNKGSSEEDENSSEEKKCKEPPVYCPKAVFYVPPLPGVGMGSTGYITHSPSIMYPHTLSIQPNLVPTQYIAPPLPQYVVSSYKNQNQLKQVSNNQYRDSADTVTTNNFEENNQKLNSGSLNLLNYETFPLYYDGPNVHRITRKFDEPENNDKKNKTKE